MPRTTRRSAAADTVAIPPQDARPRRSTKRAAAPTKAARTKAARTKAPLNKAQATARANAALLTTAAASLEAEAEAEELTDVDADVDAEEEEEEEEEEAEAGAAAAAAEEEEEAEEEEAAESIGEMGRGKRQRQPNQLRGFEAAHESDDAEAGGRLESRCRGCARKSHRRHTCGKAKVARSQVTLPVAPAEGLAALAAAGAAEGDAEGGSGAEGGGGAGAGAEGGGGGAETRRSCHPSLLSEPSGDGGGFLPSVTVSGAGRGARRRRDEKNGVAELNDEVRPLTTPSHNALSLRLPPVTLLHLLPALSLRPCARALYPLAAPLSTLHPLQALEKGAAREAAEAAAWSARRTTAAAAWAPPQVPSWRVHASFVDCTRAPLWEPGGPLDPSTPLPLHGAPPPPRDFWSCRNDFWSAQPEGGAPLQGDGDSSRALAWRVPAAAPTAAPAAPPAAPIAPPHAAARTHFWTAVPSGVSSVVMNHWRELRQAEGGAEGGGGGGGEREAGGGGMRGGGGGGGGSEGARGPETVDSFPLECVWEQIDARTVHAVEACAAAAALRAPPPPPPPPPRTASTARSTAHPAAAAARGARRTDLFGEGRIAGDGSLQGMHLYSSPPRAAVPRAAVPPPPAVEPASATSAARTLPPQKEEDDWVQCEACLKWRRLPPGVPPPADDDPWRCEMSADAARQTCAAEEELETNRTDTKLWAGAEAAGWVARRRGNYNWVYIAPGGGKFSSVVKARRSAGRPEPPSTALQLPQPLQPPPNVLPSAPAHVSPLPAAPPPPPPAALRGLPRPVGR